MFYKNRSFIAVIGDIRESRTLEHRRKVQEHLETVLKELNESYSDDIAAKFLITLGDEFQGLLFSGKNLLKMIERIKIELYPVTFRFGIGIGPITTDIHPEMALGADGPAFYHARSAIQYLKENESKKKSVLADICFKSEEENCSEERLLNTVFSLLCALEHTWTDRQREIIWDMLIHQDGQSKTASRAGISQASVNRALSFGSYYTYEKAIKEINTIIEEISL
ncbi:MAG TPA: SatD family protein [Candidatus Eisenbergiella merdipullorum]|uniref:SatD family protein n=1 Tax=Candidatus Eisenbergiella merdipullorum TaxID=2838553 RepID=A0A9D2I4I4_9FIRM|nr:SatD family protein [Candidatus Eisenbergiella merdipullorum]